MRKKQAFISDVQLYNFDAYSVDIEGFNSRLLIGCETIVQAANYPEVGSLFINGDLFHDRKQLAIDVLHMAMRTIEDIANSIPVFINVGNHDQFRRDGSIHSPIVFEKMRNVTVVPKDGIIRENVAMLPFKTDEGEVVKWIDSVVGEADVLLLHQGVKGALLSNGAIGRGIDLEALHPDKWKLVLLGHYHKPQALAPNVHYIGSPYQIDWGEAGEVKRFIVWDGEEMTSVPTGSPEFRKISLEKYRALSEEERNEHYYRIILPKGEKTSSQTESPLVSFQQEEEALEVEVKASPVLEDAVSSWLKRASREDLVEEALNRIKA